MKNKYPEIRLSGYDTEWFMKKLGDITDIKDSSRISNALWISNGVPYLRSSDLSNDNIKGELFLSKKTYKEYSSKTGAPTRGDLLFTSGGKIGVTYYKENDDELYVQGGSILYAKTSESEHLDGRFLKSYFDTPILKKYIESASTGLTIKHFTLKPAKDTPIAIPELDEQKKIGLFFKDLDDTISLHQQELDALKQTKQGFLQKMFPKKGKKIPEVRFTGSTIEWQEIRLGDKAIIKGRLGWKSLKQEEYILDGPALIAGKHIKNGKVKWDKVDHIPKWRYDESPEIMLENGDVIFSKDGSLGNPALIEDLNLPATINSTMMLVRVNKTLDPLFFYQVMVSNTFKKLIYLKVSGSSIPHLFQADMNDFTFLTPEKSEQVKIGEFLKKMDEIIELKEQELKALKKTKQGFLQKMFV